MMMTHLLRAWLLLFVFGDATAPDGGTGEIVPATGTICLDLPGPGGFVGKSQREEPRRPTGETASEWEAKQKWRVQIDTRPPIEIKSPLRVCLGGFALTSPHRVRLYRNARVDLADRFRFSESSVVTVKFDSFYANFKVTPKSCLDCTKR